MELLASPIGPLDSSWLQAAHSDISLDISCCPLPTHSETGKAKAMLINRDWQNLAVSAGTFEMKAKERSGNTGVSLAGSNMSNPGQ